MKPSSTDKSKTWNNIILNENDKTIKDGKESQVNLINILQTLSKR